MISEAFTRRSDLDLSTALLPFGFDSALDVCINDYDPIAAVFDAVMGDDFHDATHALRLEVAKAAARQGALRCLDLCAGTGQYLSRLSATHSLDAWSIDLSEGQTLVARDRASRDPGIFRHEVADVRTSALPEDMDLVSINFDALNHIHGIDAWRNLFCRAHAALGPSGSLVFDINLPQRLLQDWDHPEVIAKADLTYVQLALPAVLVGRGVYRRTPMIIYHRQGDGIFRRHLALVEQFSIPLKDVLDLLRGCGFAALEVIQTPSPNQKGHPFNKNRAFIWARK